MFCTQCRNEIPNTASFCPKCGAKVAAGIPLATEKPRAIPSVRMQPAAASATTAAIAGASTAAAKTATAATTAMEGAAKVASKTASAAAGIASKVKTLVRGASASTIKEIASCILYLLGMWLAGVVVCLMLAQPCISISVLGQQATLGSTNLFDFISGIANSGLVTPDNAGNWASDIHWLLAHMPEELRASILIPCGWAIVWTITPIIIGLKALFGSAKNLRGWLVFAVILCMALCGYVGGIENLDIQVTESVQTVFVTAIAGIACLTISDSLEEN